MLSTGAFNALLKTLEEPPEHVKFILATTEPQKLPATILSRCQRFDFKKISDKDIMARLNFVCSENNVKIDEEALKLIAVLSEGAMRDALSILERCIQDGDNSIDSNKIKDLVGIPKLTSVHNITQSIIENSVENAIEEIDNVLNDGKDLTNFLWEIIKYSKDILVIKVGKKIELYNNEELAKIKELADKTSKDRLLNIIFNLSELENKIKQSSQKTIIFQTGIINLCINEETKGLEERIKALEEKIKNTSVVISQEQSKNISVKERHIEKEEKPVVLEEKKDKSKKEEDKINIQTVDLKSQEFWPNILQKLKSNGKVMLYANLLNSRAIELNDMTIGIEFSGGLNDFRKQLLETNENRREIEKLVSIVCGKEMQIKYIDKPESNIKASKSNSVNVETTKKEQNVSTATSLEDLGLDINYIDD